MQCTKEIEVLDVSVHFLPKENDQFLTPKGDFQMDLKILIQYSTTSTVSGFAGSHINMCTLTHAHLFCCQELLSKIYLTVCFLLVWVVIFVS